MLSRIAESLFWIGRYVERADDTARLLDVHIHQLLEDTTDASSRAPVTLLPVMGLSSADRRETDLDEVVHLLALSDSQPSSIVSSLRSARENARGVREAISSELWECLNSTAASLEEFVAGADLSAHEFFRFSLFVRQRVATAVGIAEASMSRDDGWRFLVLGRSLERADMTARLVATRLNDARGEADWAPTLRACSAYEAYLRTYHGAMSPMNAVEFLILDRYFPRSIYFSLSLSESCLNELEPRRGRTASEDEAARLIGRTRATLGYRTVGEILDNVPGHLRSVQEACGDASRMIARDYFQRESTLAWRSGGDLEEIATR